MAPSGLSEKRLYGCGRQEPTVIQESAPINPALRAPCARPVCPTRTFLRFLLRRFRSRVTAFTCFAASALPSKVRVSCLAGQARKGRYQRTSGASFHMRPGKSDKATNSIGFQGQHLIHIENSNVKKAIFLWSVRLFALIFGFCLLSCGPPKSFQTYDDITLEVPAIELPDSAIDPIPISVGIYYDRWFIDHTLSVFVAAKGITPYEITRYSVDLGKPSIQMVDQAAAAIFSDVEIVTEAEWQFPASNRGPEAVLRPFITNVELNGQNEIEYLFRLHTPQGEIIEEIRASGRSAGRASGEGLADAIRVAAAQLMVKLVDSEKVREWLNALPSSNQLMTDEGA